MRQALTVAVFVSMYLSPVALPLERASAQERESGVPERTVAAAGALAGAQWETSGEGYDFIRARTTAGLSLTAFRFSPDRFTFSLVVQNDPKGERVDSFGSREDASIAINGGFFGEEAESGELFSVGMLRIGGKDHSQAWEKTGGMAVFDNGRLALAPSSAGVPKDARTVLQSKPMLIEPGGKWAMNTNQEHRRKRSILCLLPGGEVILFAVTGGGLSLYEAGWLMRTSEEGGFFGCDSALAFDGGGSTQVWVADHPELSFRGETPVHNALIVRRREDD